MPVEQRAQQGRPRRIDSIAGQQRHGGGLPESLPETVGLQPDPADLTVPLQVHDEPVLDMAAQLGDGSRRSQRSMLQHREGRPGDRIQRCGTGQRDQMSGRDVFTIDGRADPTRVREIQQHRGTENVPAALPVQSGLCRCVVEEKEQQVLGDLGHTAQAW